MKYQKNEAPIKVMHLRDSQGIYGAERVIFTIGKNLDDEKFKFYLLCMKRKSGASQKLIATAGKIGIDVLIVDVNGRLDLRAIYKIRKIVKNYHISIIHTHDYKSDVYALLATIGLKVRRVLTAHGSTRDSILKKAYLYITEKLIYKFYDQIIAVSKDLFHQLKQKNINTDRIEIIQNGIDPSILELQVENGAATKLNIPPNKNQVFGVIGRLFPDKGHQFFVEAFAHTQKIFPDIYGIFIGDGPSKNEIEGQISSFGMQENISLLGFQQDMHQLYKSLDYVVIPSVREGLPYVLLESMALGIPVIATSVGDIPKLVINNLTGYLVPPKDAFSLENRMKDLLDDPLNAKTMGRNANKFVLEKFSASTMVRKTEKLYQSII